MTFSITEEMIKFFSGNLGSYWGTGTGGQITGNPTGGATNGGSEDFDWSSEIPDGTYIDMEVVGHLPIPNLPDEWNQLYIDGNFYFFDQDGRLRGGSIRVDNPGTNLFDHVPRDAQGHKIPGTWYVNGQMVVVAETMVFNIGDDADTIDHFDGVPVDEDGNHLPGEWTNSRGEYVVVAERMVFHIGDSSDETATEDAQDPDEVTVDEGGVPVVRGSMIIFDMTDDTITVVGDEEEDAPVQPEMHFDIVDAPLSSALSEGKGAYVQLGASTRMQNIRFVDDHTGQERVGSFSLETSTGHTTHVTVGTSGNDTIIGSGWVMGADGNDSLSGGASADLILGGNGNDVIAGGAGADTLNGGKGVDTLDYGSDTAGIYADLGTNSAFHGLAEGDRISDFENVVGGAGRDTIYGSADANVLKGQAGDDIMASAGGNDSLYGGTGKDTLYGDGGNDFILGEDGNDVIRGGAGADTLDGGAGIDTLDYSSATGGVYVDIQTGSTFFGEAEGDRISGFENVVGGSGRDMIYGSSDANELNGQSGDDILAGAGGHDTLWGGTGNDWLEGGAGNDVVSGGVGADTLSGGDGIDTLVYDGAEGALVDLRTGYVAGQAAGDMIGGFENVLGGSGNDTVYGSADANELNGQGGNDILAGADGADTLWGGAGNDWLEGGNGDDLVAGGAGDDRLVGGGGNDVLHGEAGRDFFVFESALNAATNVDRVADFSVAEDWIGLSRGVFGGFGNSVSLVVGAVATADNVAQIVYNDATGGLFYDADGNGTGAQVKFAQLAAGLALTAGNFVLL